MHGRIIAPAYSALAYRTQVKAICMEHKSLPPSVAVVLATAIIAIARLWLPASPKAPTVGALPATSM